MKLRAMVLVFSLFSPVLVAQGASKKPISLPKLPPTTPQGTEGAFWRTDNNFDPILRLKNVLLKQSLQVTPSIYFADGTQYKLAPVTLEPAGTGQIDLLYAIQSAPANIQEHISTYGMAGIDYQWSWPAVIATVQNTDEIASLTFVSAFHSDVRQVHARPEAAEAQVVRGTWWLPTPDSDGFLVLENPSLNPKHVDIRISGNAGNQLAQQQVTLPSHATSFLKFSAMFGDVRGSETMGGIDIRYTGPGYGVLIYGGIVDETHGYSASPILMEDHLDPNRPTHAVTLSVPGLLLGNADPAMEFPAETYFRPYALLHNLSGHAMQVSLALTTQGTSGQPQDISLDPVTLAPGQVIKYDFASQFGKSSPLPNGYGSLTASFQGRDGDLQIHAGSVDQSHSYVFEVPASQQADSSSRTLCFWSIEGDNDSMITVWNYKSTPQDLNLTLHYSGGQYVLPIHLAPRQAYNLDMLSLVRSQVPDSNGAIIPSNIASGSGTLSGVHGERETISVAIAASVFNVRNATCGYECYVCDGAVQEWLNPNPFFVETNQSIQMQYMDQWDTGAEYDITGEATWSGGGPISVSDTGSITGNWGGSASVSASDSSEPLYSQYCSQAGPDPCPVNRGVGIGEQGQVGDQTPTISSVSPAVINAGQTSQLTIEGSGFGTNQPGLSFSDSQVSFTITSYNDSQIIVNVTPPAGTNETLYVSVTSNGYTQSGFGFYSGGGGQSATSGQGSTQVQSAAVPSATMSVSFTGSKSSDDQLFFNVSPDECSESLGPQTCPHAWLWNLEVKGIVSDDATDWTVSQAIVSGRERGYYTDSNGLLQPFSGPIPAKDDTPNTAVVQQIPGTSDIYWLDGPGHLFLYNNSYPIDSMTYAVNFSSKLCNRSQPSVCANINWYEKLVIDTGNKINTNESSTGLGSVSLNF